MATLINCVLNVFYKVICIVLLQSIKNNGQNLVGEVFHLFQYFFQYQMFTIIDPADAAIDIRIFLY